MVFGIREEVVVWYDEIGKLFFDDLFFLVFFVGKLGDIFCLYFECGFVVKVIGVGIDLYFVYGFVGDYLG